jgi:hypothetical protein
MLPQLPALRLVLPRDTLAWRLQLIQQGIAWLKPRLGDVQQRTLVLGSDRDLLIPSDREAGRLSKALPRARSRLLPGRSHAPLMEAGVDLVNILKVRWRRRGVRLVCVCVCVCAGARCGRGDAQHLADAAAHHARHAAAAHARIAHLL